MLIEKFQYAIQGLIGRMQAKNICPVCGGNSPKKADGKVFHGLYRCQSCAILYRFPVESAKFMSSYYQRNYRQAGLTTDLPDDLQLSQLIKQNFKGSAKDFSHAVAIIRALGLQNNSRILDFGANWGYAVYQFLQEGLDADGYEISLPRAAFGENLGVTVASDWEVIKQRPSYDVVFSSHVLEHTPNPRKALIDQISVLKNGGYIIAFFPNGSQSFRHRDPAGFHRLWGFIHPIMLNDEFLARMFPSNLFLGSVADAGDLADWGGEGNARGDVSQGELMMVWRKNDELL